MRTSSLLGAFVVFLVLGDFENPLSLRDERRFGFVAVPFLIRFGGCSSASSSLSLSGPESLSSFSDSFSGSIHQYSVHKVSYDVQPVIRVSFLLPVASDEFAFVVLCHRLLLRLDLPLVDFWSLA